jgi:hypothetical protein
MVNVFCPEIERSILSVQKLNCQSNATGGPPPPRLRFEKAAPQEAVGQVGTNGGVDKDGDDLIVWAR